MNKNELVDFLNLMLESERAGAKVLAAFMDRYERNSDIWRSLRQIKKDEANNCKLLSNEIKRLGGQPSSRTGEFFDKAIAIDDNNERLIFLNRGQGWVAKKLREAVDNVTVTETRELIRAMIDSHVENIDLCNTYIKQ